MEGQLISGVDCVAIKYESSSWHCRCVLALIGFCIVNWLDGKFAGKAVVGNCNIVFDIVVGDLYY